MSEIEDLKRYYKELEEGLDPYSIFKIRGCVVRMLNNIDSKYGFSRKQTVIYYSHQSIIENFISLEIEARKKIEALNASKEDMIDKSLHEIISGTDIHINLVILFILTDE